jgi:ATP-dependent DNA ligase
VRHFPLIVAASLKLRLGHFVIACEAVVLGPDERLRLRRAAFGQAQ